MVFPSLAWLLPTTPPPTPSCVGMHSVLSGTRLLGKTVLITGAGRGIGRALSLGMAQEGASIVALDKVSVPEGGDLSPSSQTLNQAQSSGPQSPFPHQTLVCVLASLPHVTSSLLEAP